jgi:hypothetical protein
LLTLAHETNAIIVRQKIVQPKNCRVLVAVRFTEALMPITIAAIGSHITGGGKTPLTVSEWALFAFVEMFMTTSMAELPGVTGADGLKLHWAPAGSPRVQARDTAPLKDEPTGNTLSA